LIIREVNQYNTENGEASIYSSGWIGSMSSMTKDDVDRIISLLESIDRRLQKLAGKGVGEERLRPIDANAVLQLTPHLQPTAMKLLQLGKATAEEVAEKTGRKRAIESLYLNELVSLGYAKKEREGKTVYFSVKK